MQNKANFVQAIGVYSCEFVVNLKKQSQFTGLWPEILNTKL